MILGQAQTFASPQEALTHISEAPWSNYTKADYTLEQWHTACVLHTHDGAPTSKSECKLPVKTPDGALNRNGVYAAAAALAGARGGLKGVSANQRSKAQNAIKRYYSQLDETPPESLTQSDLDFRQKLGSPEDVLAHYGKKGMRWGVRNEDKPAGRDTDKRLTLDSAKSALAERQVERKQHRIEKFEKRSEVMSTKISEIKLKNEALQGTRNPSQLYDRYANNQTIKTLDRQQKRAVRDAEAVQKGKLTSTQKKVIIGAVGVSAILAAGAIYQGQQSGAINSVALRGAAFLRGQKVPFNVNEKLSRPMSASELLNQVAKPVNPGYSKAGGKMNCRRSTYVYELRRRGFDVHATTSGVGWGQSESGVINALTPGSKNFYRKASLSEVIQETQASSKAVGDRRVSPIKKILLDNLINEKPSLQEQARALRENGGRMPEALNQALQNAGKSNSAKVLEELAKQPHGARGEVMFKFANFGHSMAYEVVNGVPHILDGQKGTLFNASTKMVESKWDGFHGAEITRLDNVDLDLNFLTRWATNVGDK